MGELSPDLVEEVLERLGHDRAPSLDLEGLSGLYRRWCRSVPFDNTLKLLALHGGDGEAPLPGMHADSFFRSWLRHGTGATCWPGANALHALAVACGFRSRLIAASMADTGVASHGTTVVTLDSGDWLVDSSMLTDEPLALSGISETTIDHAVFPTSAQPVPEGWLLRFPLPYGDGTMPCRTIQPAAVTHDHFCERYEISRTTSVFNHLPYIRRNDEDGILCYGAGKRFRRTADGMEESDLAGPDVFAGLVREFGLSEEISAQLAATLAAAG